ncbi:MAG: YceI family protein [Bacteroidetes bacterium]|nr:YceI family protein [Bacteroidota bacterium]
MMNRMYLFLLVVVMTSQIALAQQYKTVQQMSATFQIKNAGLNVDGKFSNVKVDAMIDEKNITKSTLSGIIKANSVSTGNAKRDDHIKNKAEFFDVAKYPNIEMKAVKISPTKFKDSYKIDWLITMKGISKKVSTDVLIAPQGGSVLLLAVFKLNRLDWKLGSKSATMSDEVMITLNCTLTK